MRGEWANNLKFTECRQVYHDVKMPPVFYSPTVGYISAIINGNRVLEPSYPLEVKASLLKGMGTCFIDPEEKHTNH